MKAILQLFLDFGNDCDLDVNNHLLFYDQDDNIIHIEHSGELMIEDYFDGTIQGTKDKVQVLDGRETVAILFDGDYSLALETIIENG
jgi:ABC-type glycerol-3-phosphate transport system substrate-binding protein